MSKLLMVSLCAFLFTVRLASAEPDLPKTGYLYQVLFAQDYREVYNLDTENQYVIQIDAISKFNPNWVQVEFPQNANLSYSSKLAGKRWINLNYVMELRVYTPLPGQ